MSSVTRIHKTLNFDFGVYEGEVRAEQPTVRDGWGKLSYNNGNTYEGEWRAGAPHGTGIKLYANGDMYSGKWAEGRRDGQGRYKFLQGHQYTGEYKDDQCHGRGTLTTKHGDRYEGEWVCGRKHGSGVERLACGQLFEGTWVRGKKHGAGKTTMPSGEVVSGIWDADRCVEVTAREAAPESVARSTSHEQQQQHPQQIAPIEMTPEMQAQLSALGLTPDLMAAMMGQIATVNSTVTTQLDALSGGLERMEAQLAALTDALDIDDDGAFGDDFDSGDGHTQA